MKLSQHDTVTIRAVVELPSTPGEGVQVILQSPSGTEQRIQILRKDVVSVVPGPLKKGDQVVRTVTVKGKAIEKTGTITHREGDHAWVSWSDGHGVEALADLSRA